MNSTTLHSVENVSEHDAAAVFQRTVSKFVHSRRSILQAMTVGETIRERCATPAVHTTRLRKLWCLNRTGWSSTASANNMKVKTICVEGWLYIRRDK